MRWRDQLITPGELALECINNKLQIRIWRHGRWYLEHFRFIFANITDGPWQPLSFEQHTSLVIFFLNSQLCYATLWNLSIVRGILNMRLHDLNMEKCRRKGRNNRRYGFSTLFCKSCWPHLGYFSQNISIYCVFVPLSRRSASTTASCSGPITYNKQASYLPKSSSFPIFSGWYLGTLKVAYVRLLYRLPLLSSFSNVRNRVVAEHK